MTDPQWNTLLAVVRGEKLSRVPVGAIVDSPWLPNWAGMRIADYLASEDLWFEANLKAIGTFPGCIFLPGFWSEFGMCTEPSAFGGKCIFPPDEFPFIEAVAASPEAAAALRPPDPRTDGLLPFMLGRLKRARPRIEDLGHRIRFSVSRGPLNVATFLMGTTEFLVAIKTEPEAMHRLLRTITDFLRQWHELQRETFPSIDGILMLDDIVGMMGEADFLEFGAPYLKELYSADVAVKFFHNDADCLTSIRHYAGLGINLYNPGIQRPIGELRKLGTDRLALIGGVPPRRILAEGTPEEVVSTVRALRGEIGDGRRFILSCSGGMAPKVPTANIEAMLSAAGELG